MPLTKKGHKIMSAMKEQYGEEEGERVFYASANAGKISGVHVAKDGIVAVTDADGCLWTRALHLADNDTEFLVDKGVAPSRDGYLKAHARVARVGVQKYRGYEVGLPDRETVTLYRPPEEVFARDSMRSHANKPVTLTHPQRMVDKNTWSKVAKGFSGNEVVRDGEFVRVPLMLTDAKAIDAYETGGARELSVGYNTDIQWTPGVTPKGEHFDGVQRDIRTNHHALVPVARGGSDLNLDDSVFPGFDDAASVTCPNCGGATQPDAMTCPSCGYDLKPTPRSGQSISMDFSPDQPRDDQGKWTMGAASGATGVSAGHPMSEEEFKADVEAIKKSQLRNPPKKVAEFNKSEDYDDPDQNWTTEASRIGLVAPGKHRWWEKRQRTQNVKVDPAFLRQMAQGDGMTEDALYAELSGGQRMLSGEDRQTKAVADGGASEEEGIMPVIKMFDGIPIQFADEVSAAAMEREFRKLQLQIADAGDFGGKKRPPFSGNKKKEDGTGSDDDSGDANGHQDATGSGDSDTEARRRKVTAEDALKVAQGEIAVLRKQIADAGTLDARAEALAEQRVALLDAAKPLLPQGFKPEGKSLNDIRRAAVSTQFTDAETKDWDDRQFIGAFATMTKLPPKTGARNMADGMSQGMRANVGMVRGTNLADAEAEAAKAHAEYVQRLQDGYKKPYEVVRN